MQLPVILQAYINCREYNKSCMIQYNKTHEPDLNISACIPRALWCFCKTRRCSTASSKISAFSSLLKFLLSSVPVSDACKRYRSTCQIGQRIPHFFTNRAVRNRKILIQLIDERKRNYMYITVYTKQD